MDGERSGWKQWIIFPGCQFRCEQAALAQGERPKNARGGLGPGSHPGGSRPNTSLVSLNEHFEARSFQPANLLPRSLSLSRRKPTVVVDVVLQHLVLQDAAQLGQGFQVDDVDDQRPQDVVQGQAQLLQQLAAGG